jgi:tellurite resistance protein TehA-like permease
VITTVVRPPETPLRPQPEQRPVLFRISDLLDWVAPNWFAAVMATGILATAAVGLPVGAATAAVIRPFAVLAWVLAAGLLIGVTALTVGQWSSRSERARSHHRHPVRAHFYGAAPMALMTVGAGTLLVGSDLIGPAAAVRIDSLLWTLGTGLGLLTCFVVPGWDRRGRLGPPSAAFGGWLMPVVPPVVSASTGALLLPHLPPGAPRLALLLAGYLLFAVGLVASTVMIRRIATGLARDGRPEAAMVPTVWIVLGPLGQSVTAALALGERAQLVVGPRTAGVLRDLGLVYALPVFGLALLWLALSARITVSTIRQDRLPFAPTWWSFTFPVGTCVTGAAALARADAGAAFTGLAVTLFAGLLVAWIVVSAAALRSGRYRPAHQIEGIGSL